MVFCYRLEYERTLLSDGPNVRLTIVHGFLLLYVREAWLTNVVWAGNFRHIVSISPGEDLDALDWLVSISIWGASLTLWVRTVPWLPLCIWAHGRTRPELWQALAQLVFCRLQSGITECSSSFMHVLRQQMRWFCFYGLDFCHVTFFLLIFLFNRLERVILYRRLSFVDRGCSVVNRAFLTLIIGGTRQFRLWKMRSQVTIGWLVRHNPYIIVIQ